MMFGMIKRSTHEAVAAENEALKAYVAKLERSNERHTEARLELSDKLSEAYDKRAEVLRKADILGAALNEVIAERDQLKADAQARRAKQLANLRNQKPTAQMAGRA